MESKTLVGTVKRKKPTPWFDLVSCHSLDNFDLREAIKEDLTNIDEYIFSHTTHYANTNGYKLMHIFGQTLFRLKTFKSGMIFETVLGDITIQTTWNYKHNLGFIRPKDPVEVDIVVEANDTRDPKRASHKNYTTTLPVNVEREKHDYDNGWSDKSLKECQNLVLSSTIEFLHEVGLQTVLSGDTTDINPAYALYLHLQESKDYQALIQE